jgi:hypothetical protein
MIKAGEPSSFAHQVIRSGATPIHFIVCRDGKNRLCHYFLMCTPQKLKMLKEAKEGVQALKDYGVIVASGFGREPSASVIAMMKEKYNLDFDALS